MQIFGEISSLVMPDGIYEDLITKKFIPQDQQDQVSNFTYSKEISLDTVQPILDVIFETHEYYRYFITGFKCSYPPLANGDISQDVRVKLIDGYSNKKITPYETPIPVRLMTTPTQEQVLRVIAPIYHQVTTDAYIHLQFSNFTIRADTFLKVTVEGVLFPREVPRLTHDN